MVYLKEFETVSAYETFAASEYFVEPNVSMIGEYGESGFAIKYNKDKPTPSHDYSQDYLTLEFLENGYAYTYIDNIYYSLDGGDTWEEFTSSEVTMHSGDKLMLKGYNIDLSSETYGLLSTDGSFNIYGNIMSLVDGDNFTTATTVTNNQFQYCFVNQNIISAENLVLPATTLASACYYDMFENCYNLTKAPALPATTLAPGCYGSMFRNCSSLTTAPELPATTLAESCYESMFFDCSSLTTAPELPATTLANQCYANMFQNCNSLTTAPELPATTLANYCYFGMFQECSSLNYIKCLATNISASNCTINWVDWVASAGTFVKDANMSSWTTGSNGIPSGWTVEDAS